MIDEIGHDCIIVGAGPGGLQAAIYLGRFNRKVLLIDRGGGRTWHARHIENFLTRSEISGREVIKLGKQQALRFHAEFINATVTDISRKEFLEVRAGEKLYRTKFVVVSSGGTENLPPIENVHRFLGDGFYTCIDCDGYKTTGRKLVVLGNSLKTVHLALAMKTMYTNDITLILYFLQLPDHYREELQEESIVLINDRPVRLTGGASIEGIELQDGRIIPCEAVMSNFGYKLNDSFMQGLNLKRDAEGFKYITNKAYESSLNGLYIVGPLTGNDQVVIAAGAGAIAAIDINKRLLQY